MENEEKGYINAKGRLAIGLDFSITFSKCQYMCIDISITSSYILNLMKFNVCDKQKCEHTLSLKKPNTH